jgi:hypothetical protein
MAHSVPHNHKFTAAALEDIRRRYVETDEPLGCIAALYGMHRNTPTYLACKYGWQRRRDRPPRDVPEEVRLSMAAERALDAQLMIVAPAFADGAPDAGPAYAAAAQDAGMPDDADAADKAATDALASSIPLSDTAAALPLALRLEQAVMRELARVERLRSENVGSAPRSAESERIARTLSTLTQTLSRVRALQEPERFPDDDHDQFDDMPADIDDFRRELARRIDAFVASRTDAGVSATGEPDGAAPPVA